MVKYFATLLACAALFLAGCSQKQTEQTPEETPQMGQADQQNEPQAQPEKQTNTQASNKTMKKSSRTAGQQAPKAEEAKPVVLEVPAGMQLVVALSDSINSGKNKTGEKFDATLAKPIVVNGQTVIEEGAPITGEIILARGSSGLKSTAELVLTLNEIEAHGQAYHVTTTTVEAKEKSKTGRNVGMIGGGAAVGTAIGAIAGKKKGAIIGGVAGAAAGTGAAVLTGKKNLLYPAGSELTFILQQPMKVTVKKSALAAH